MRSSSMSGINAHERATQHLQRQSTANSSRRYYFGDQRDKANSRQKTNRAPSPSSSSSSSELSNPKKHQHKSGTRVRSRDSGFREDVGRVDTPLSQQSANNQIYSVSSKSKKGRQYAERDELENQRRNVVSPTPTTASLGQRSVKTTTTTVSAGLADRPLSRQDRSTSTYSPTPTKNKGQRRDGPIGGATKVSKPPSPFQRLAQMFAPSTHKSRQVAAK